MPEAFVHTVNGVVVEDTTNATPVVNRRAVLVKARAALTANQAKINAAKPATAAAQASQAYDNSIVAFRQINALLRELLDDFSDVSDT